MEILSRIFSDHFLRLVKLNLHSKILEEFKRKATMQDGDCFYFDLEDSSNFHVSYELDGNWGTIKAFIDDPNVLKSIRVNCKGGRS